MVTMGKWGFESLMSWNTRRYQSIELQDSWHIDDFLLVSKQVLSTLIHKSWKTFVVNEISPLWGLCSLTFGFQKKLKYFLIVSMNNKE